MSMKKSNGTDDAASQGKGSAAPQGVGLLMKAFQILDLFTDEIPTWTQVELAQATGLARSTLGRLVRFLNARGYLMYQEQRGRYSLGFAAIDLGGRAQAQFNLVEACFDVLEELAQLTAETVILTGYDQARARVVCLAQIPSRLGGLRVFENIGTAFPLHSGATAKAVLAYLPETTVKSVLNGDLTALNPKVKVTLDGLAKDIAAVREQGYAVSREETYPGVGGIAVPILTPHGQALGSIAIAAPIQRLNPEAIASYSETLIKAGLRVRSRIAGSA